MAPQPKTLLVAAVALAVVIATVYLYQGSSLSYTYSTCHTDEATTPVHTRELTSTCPPEKPPVVKEVFVEKVVYLNCTTQNPPITSLPPPQPSSSRDLHYPFMLYEGFDSSSESAKIIAHDQGAANVMFLIWCGADRLFEFKHMLSILSAIKMQQPLKVTLYHWPNNAPKEDLYNNWLTELRQTFYNFEVAELTADIVQPQRCDDPSQIATAISNILQGYGGIYINENVIITKALNSYRTQSFVFVDSNGVPAVVIGKGLLIENIIRPANIRTCTTDSNFSPDSTELCIHVQTDKLYPRDIMVSEHSFHKVCRHLFYGSTDKKEPHYDLSNPIPNIGHFYLLGDNFINFFIYLSIVSMVNVLKNDMVYLHGDIEPHGDYWDRLKSTGKVQFVFCPPVQTVFGNQIDPNDKFHGKDILSVYFLYLYGGVFVDWDAIFTRPLDDGIRGYDAVVGFDWFIPSEAPTFPEVINPGVLAAKRHSVFISMWLEKYKDFGKKGGFYYTGLLVPYKLYERYPETVKLDPKFQVICWQQTCHPPWMTGYQGEKFHSEFDWETVYSVHFTYPDPVEFYNEGNLKNATSMIGQMGQRVMGWY